MDIGVLRRLLSTAAMKDDGDPYGMGGGHMHTLFIHCKLKSTECLSND